MGKGGGSWIRMLKKAIHEHIHGDVDEDILRFPHLPHHKKSQQRVTTTRDPPTASAASQKTTCACSCKHISASSQVSIVDRGSGRNMYSNDGNNSSGRSSYSIRLSDCGSSTGSCCLYGACCTTNSNRIHPRGDSHPPTEERRLYREADNEVDDREAVATLVNLWGPH